MPFSQTLFCYKNENQLKLKHLSILLNEFYNPNTYIITVDNKNIPGLFQIKTNISYNFLTGINKPTLLKTGITTLFNKNLIENNNDLKLCTGIQITKENFYGNINGTINFSIKQQNEYLQFFNDGYSVQTNASFYINNIKPQFGITFSSEPDSKRNYYTYSEKLSLNFLYNEKFNFSNSNSIIFKEKKNELIDTSFTSSLNVKFQSRSCTLQLHLEFQV